MERKTDDTQIENQVDKGSPQDVNGPKYLMITHQTYVRIGVPNKAKSIAAFDKLNIGKKFVDVDGVRHPRIGVSTEYASNDYLDHYSDLKLFFEMYVREEPLNFL